MNSKCSLVSSLTILTIIQLRTSLNHGIYNIYEVVFKQAIYQIYGYVREYSRFIGFFHHSVTQHKERGKKMYECFLVYSVDFECVFVNFLFH